DLVIFIGLGSSLGLSSFSLGSTEIGTINFPPFWSNLFIAIAQRIQLILNSAFSFHLIPCSLAIVMIFSRSSVRSCLQKSLKTSGSLKVRFIVLIIGSPFCLMLVISVPYFIPEFEENKPLFGELCREQRFFGTSVYCSQKQIFSPSSLYSGWRWKL